jgi:hypothetical protein
MRASCGRSVWPEILVSAVGVMLVCLGASLVRQWWQRPRLRTSRLSGETSDAAALAVAVGAMSDEGGREGATS